MSGKNCLHKVRYTDEVVSELMDDPEVALFSKGVHWAYEREWRLFRKTGTESALISVNGENIRLFDLPTSAIRRIIIGPRTPSDVERDVVELAELYSWRVQRYRIRPFCSMFVEEDLEAGTSCSSKRSR